MKTFIAICFTLLLAGGTAAADTMTPTETYQAYLQAFQDASSLQDILPYFSSAQQAKMNAMSPDDQDKAFQAMKSMAPTDVTVVKESIAGAKATVRAEGTSNANMGGAIEKMYGLVRMVMESDGWKIEKESWDSHPR